MLEVLIVDDEPLVQVGIQSMIDWQAKDLRLLPAMPNGQAAFDFIREKGADIVLTDVRMPVVDGISLIKKCKNELERCPEFIVMSSYEEFDYVREAMKYNAVDYLVKLEINAGILNDSLDKAKALCIRNRAGNFTKGLPETMGPLHGNLADTSALVDRAFQRLLSRDYTSIEDFHQNLANLGTSFDGERFALLSCRTIHPATSFQNEEERLRSFFCAAVTMRDFLAREYKVHTLYEDSEHFLIFASIGATQDCRGTTAVAARFQNSVSSAGTMVHKYFTIELRCGVSALFDNPLCAPAALPQSRAAFDLTDPDHPVAMYRELNPTENRADSERGSAGSESEKLRNALERALFSQDPDVIAALCEEAVTFLAEPGLVFASGVDFCASLCHAVVRTIPEGERLLNALFVEHPEGFRCLYTQQNSLQLRRWLERMLQGLQTEIAKNGAGYKEQLAQAMQHFADTRFRERLTLNQLAEHFSISPNYAGLIFKKHCGVGFPEYIARLKVETARGLIDQGRHRIYEISDMVGFESSFYFSKVFKKICGQSPSDYAANRMQLQKVEAEPGTLPA